MARNARAVNASLVAAALLLSLVASVAWAQTESSKPATSYIVGPQDMLMITSYDQPDLSGRFTLEADGTFTYPLIGRFRAGGLTLRQIEEGLKKRLKDEGYFYEPAGQRGGRAVQEPKGLYRRRGPLARHVSALGKHDARRSLGAGRVHAADRQRRSRDRPRRGGRVGAGDSDARS